MAQRIGILLPRSTDYPSMGFDMLDGFRFSLKNSGGEDPVILTESIGFGEDLSLNYAKAEKLFLQDQADMIIAYAGSSIAETLYQLADALGKPLIVLDPGMQHPQLSPSPFCYHISLQGLHACRVAGSMAGAGNRKVLMATSFYDGGYKGPWSYDRGLSEAGGSVCANYVSGYKVAEFTIDPYIGMLHQAGASSVAACFSSYLAELFFRQLAEKKNEAVSLPFYCSPFMAEEELLHKCDFPGGDFHTVVTWASSLNNPEQELFRKTVEKNKPVNIFHLLGWEAGLLTLQLFHGGVESLKGFSYLSPRGTVTVHPTSQYTYSPLYKGRIIAGSNGKCALEILETLPVPASDHLNILRDKPDAGASGWRNNYLCI